MARSGSRPAAPPEAYTREYYERGCGGHELFRRSAGSELPERILFSLGLVPPRDGARILDVGGGRGEAALALGRRSAAKGGATLTLDFSPDAAVIARDAFRRAEGGPRATSILGSATALPLREGSVDVVLLLDVVEHLTAADGTRALAEARRALVPQGILVVHTSPNLWYYRFGYPLYRALERLRGKRLPRDPRDRNRYLGAMHVNEQTPASLRRSLRAAGFEVRLFLRPADPAPGEPDRRIRSLLAWLAARPLLRNVLCNDIFVVACLERRL